MDNSKEDNELLDLADHANLVAVARFARSIDRVPWFAAVGKPLEGVELNDAQAYLMALGIPDFSTASPPSWEEVQMLALSADWNLDWWETEEQLRAGLTATAIELSGELEVIAALTHIASQTESTIPEAAYYATAHINPTDDSLTRSVVNSATQACCDAALVLAASADPNHAFALRFRLFEVGHWPISITGNTLHLF